MSKEVTVFKLPSRVRACDGVELVHLKGMVQFGLEENRSSGADGGDMVTCMYHFC